MVMRALQRRHPFWDNGDVDEYGNPIPGKPAGGRFGNNITLAAEYGTIGAPGDDIDIDSAHSAAGTLTSYSEFNTYIIEPLGDLSLSTVETNAGTASSPFLRAAS